MLNKLKEKLLTHISDTEYFDIRYVKKIPENKDILIEYASNNSLKHHEFDVNYTVIFLEFIGGYVNIIVNKPTNKRLHKSYKETSFKNVVKFILEVLRKCYDCYELCPCCDCEVGLKAVFKIQKCPMCGSDIKPCSLCDMDIVECSKCVLGKE